LVLWCVAAAVLGLAVYFLAFWFYPQEGGDASPLNTIGLVVGAMLFFGAVLVFLVGGALHLFRGGGS
jgi:hypothetical protein